MNELVVKAKAVVGKTKYQAVKHAPEILLGVGVASIIASTVLACRATIKAVDICEEHKENMSKLDVVMHDPEYAEARTNNNYTQSDYEKDQRIVTINTCVDIAKTYAPAVIFGVVGVGCLIQSHNILNKRNAALVAAYETLDKSYREYRKRVIDEMGKDADLRFQGVEKEVRQIVNENGDVEVEENLKVGPDYSPYAKFYDEGCRDWCKDGTENYYRLKTIENYANQLLKSQGFVFLNEVYDLLDIPKTSQGQIVGWCLNNPDGDGYIDFGLSDPTSASLRRFVNGDENVVLLDFNVDGPIINMI